MRVIRVAGIALIGLADLELEGLAGVLALELDAIEDARAREARGRFAGAVVRDVLGLVVFDRDLAVLRIVEGLKLGVCPLVAFIGLGHEGELALAQPAARERLLDVDAALGAERGRGLVGVRERVAAVVGRQRGPRHEHAAVVEDLDADLEGVGVILPVHGAVCDALVDLEPVGANLGERHL